MKHLKKNLAVALVLSLLIMVLPSGMIPMAGAASSRKAVLMNAPEAGTVYKLSDYTNQLKKIIVDSGADEIKYQSTASVNSPWSAQLKNNNDGGNWKVMDRVVRAGVGYGYIQICDSKNGSEWFYPGAEFHTGTDNKGFDATKLTPLKSSTKYGGVDFSAAWAFTVPAAGLYTFSHSPDNDSASFELTQFFGGNSSAQQTAVRITVDDQKIWPAGKDAEIISGNAVQIPFIENIELAAGQVLRVEARGLTNDDVNTYDQRINASGLMTYVGPIPSDTTAPEFASGDIAASDISWDSMKLTWPEATDNKTAATNLIYKVFTSDKDFTAVPTEGGATAINKTSATLKGLTGDTDYYVAVVVYDANGNTDMLKAGPFKTKKTPTFFNVYDYANDAYTAMKDKSEKYTSITKVETDSPWRVAIQDAPGEWSIADMGGIPENGFLYVSPSNATNWSQWYPGARFNYGIDDPNEGWYHMSVLMPAHADPAGTLYHHDTGFAFIAPLAGTYTFGQATDSAMGNFHAFCSLEDAVMGVRITVNDKQIWPSEADIANENRGYVIRDKYAEIKGNDTTGVKIPTIAGLEMKAGEVLRVEATAFTIVKDSSQQQCPWYQNVAANVGMMLTELAPPDTQAPVFAQDAAATVENVTKDSFTVIAPAATDDQTLGDGITYTVYVSKTAFEDGQIPTEGGIVAEGMKADFIGLDAETDYYVLVVAADVAGNKATLKTGPFKTLKEGSDPTDPDTPRIELPDAPLMPNKTDEDAGIISNENGTIQIGWNPTSGISFYKVYLFEKSGSGFELALYSDDLLPTADSYTFEGVADGEYVIQVVGYNQQGDALAIYSMINLSLKDGSGNQDKDDVPKTGEKFIPLLLVLAGTSAGMIYSNKKKKTKTAQ